MADEQAEYETEREYIFKAHPEFRWVFDIERMAESWPGYTEALGKEAQAQIVKVAVKHAKKVDAGKKIDVRITGRPSK
jgi:hypothetical protein